jgi:hypothetical protein
LNPTFKPTMLAWVAGVLKITPTAFAWPKLTPELVEKIEFGALASKPVLATVAFVNTTSAKAPGAIGPDGSESKLMLMVVANAVDVKHIAAIPSSEFSKIFLKAGSLKGRIWRPYSKL